MLRTAALERAIAHPSTLTLPKNRILTGQSRNLVCNLARTKSSYPTASEVAPEGKLSAVLLTLALSGATTGTLLDGIHSRVGVLIYDSAPIQFGGLSTSVWVPPLLAAFYFVMGGLVIYFDSRLVGYDPTTRGALREANLFKMVVSFGALAAMLELSSYMYSTDMKSSTICLALALCAAINYLVLDSTKQGLALALLCALGAPLLELVLMQSMHLWHYPQGDLHTSIAGALDAIFNTIFIAYLLKINPMTRFSAPLLILLAAAAVVVATASGRTLLQEDCSSVFDLVSTNPELSTLKSVIEAAGREDTLSDTELQATLFAPSNEAFERLARDTGTTVEGILNAPADLLTDLLEYHVIPGPGIEASQLKTGLRFNTLNGDPVLVESQKIKPEPKYAGCASLDIHMDTYIDEDPEPLICDIKACNALVHIVDYPLIPNNAQIRTLLPEGKFKTQLSG